MLQGEKILITGAAGQVGTPVAAELAKTNEVWGLGRFNNPADRDRLERFGVRCVAADLAVASFDNVPDDVSYVLNFAVSKSPDANFEYDIAANAEGTGLLMAHCRSAKAFLHCSTTAVYQPAGHQPLREADPLGDNHRVWGFLATYSISKIAAEATARTAARTWSLPTVIARLNVPYGANGGWPAMHLDTILSGEPVAGHPDEPNLFNPIHEDDIVAQIPRLLEVASVPATTVNWAGEQSSIEEWCAYLGELVGRTPSFVRTEQTISSVTTDNTLMHQLIGEPRVAWKDGMRRMTAARHPELGIAGLLPA